MEIYPSNASTHAQTHTPLVAMLLQIPSFCEAVDDKGKYRVFNNGTYNCSLRYSQLLEFYTDLELLRTHTHVHTYTHAHIRAPTHYKHTHTHTLGYSITPPAEEQVSTPLGQPIGHITPYEHN